MINVEVTVSGTVLRDVKAKGHAQSGKFGENIVCAAVTTLLRTTTLLIEAQTDITIRGGAENPGTVSLIVDEVPPFRRTWLEGVTDFFLFGLRLLENEYPQEIMLTIKSSKE